MARVRHWLVPALAIAGIVAMQVNAMAHGHDGLILSLALMAVAGIAGYNLKIRQ